MMTIMMMIMTTIRITKISHHKETEGFSIDTRGRNSKQTQIRNVIAPQGGEEIPTMRRGGGTGPAEPRSFLWRIIMILKWNI